jgi:hypothetical protein
MSKEDGQNLETPIHVNNKNYLKLMSSLMLSDDDDDDDDNDDNSNSGNLDDALI